MYYLRKIKAINASILVAIVSFVIIIPTGAIITSSNYFGTTNFAYGQASQMNSNNTNSVNIQNIPAKKVHVGDIDIAYKTFGKGDPILLLSGVPMTMDNWPPSILNQLSLNHTVVIFDYRGVGNTTSGTKPFSIQQFANDTNGLLDTLKIQKADVLGFSLGSFVAQELTVIHPEKVNRLVLYAASCGGIESAPQNPEVIKVGKDIANSVVNNTPIQPQEVRTLLSLILGSGWMKLHPNFLETNPKFTDLFSGFTPNTIMHLQKAAQTWIATNWTGICSQLSKISKPTLVITGTDDVIAPSANSLIIAEKLPGAWLVQINGAGHALMFQYPDKFNKVVQTFLTTTSG